MEWRASQVNQTIGHAEETGLFLHYENAFMRVLGQCVEGIGGGGEGGHRHFAWRCPRT